MRTSQFVIILQLKYAFHLNRQVCLCHNTWPFVTTLGPSHCRYVPRHLPLLRPCINCDALDADITEEMVVAVLEIIRVVDVLMYRVRISNSAHF